METNTAELIENLRRSQAENGQVEVKAAAGGFPRSVLETVSAFANGDGGTILLGLTDPAEGLQPVEGFNAQAVHDASVEAIRSKITPRPPVDIHIEAAEDQHRIVRIDVLPGDPTLKPYYIEAHGMYNGSYQRVGEADIRLTKYEIDRLLENRSQPRYDEELISEASFKDLSPTLVSAYVARLREEQPRVFAALSDREVLLQARILRIDSEGREVPTLGALLAMGSYPQAFFPQLMMSVVVLPGEELGEVTEDGRRFLDNHSCTGPIPSMLDEAMGVLVRNMRKTSTMEGLNSSGIGRVERYEYPLEAIRELLVNALMHRDYSPGARGSQVQVELYTNRLVVRSPGGIYGAVAIRDFGQPGVSSTRNSYLASILTDLPDPVTGRLIAENRASGIPTVLRALKDAGLPAPQFADRLLYVQVTLMQPPQGVSSTEQKTAPEDKTQQATRLAGKHSVDTVEPAGADASLDGLSERQAGIVRGLRAQGEAVSAAFIQEHWGRSASRTSITNDLRSLVDAKLIVPTAPPRSKNRKYRAA
ncbi:ATP-binding protein [uncultured Rothia sp.]|uniref:ATP-binding protein n=1 Tax=uncultured Rothia sp. TaxID=316088 RepID=UPI0028DCB3FE|nr:ATP-binding protein [uncultured Rothia sp.]